MEERDSPDSRVSVHQEFARYLLHQVMNRSLPPPSSGYPSPLTASTFMSSPTSSPQLYIFCSFRLLCQPVRLLPTAFSSSAPSIDVHCTKLTNISFGGVATWRRRWKPASVSCTSVARLVDGHVTHSLALYDIRLTSRCIHCESLQVPEGTEEQRTSIRTAAVCGRRTSVPGLHIFFAQFSTRSIVHAVFACGSLAMSSAQKTMRRMKSRPALR